MHFWEPIGLLSTTITYAREHPHTFSEFERQFIDHLPYIFLQHYPDTCLNFSIGFFEEDKDTTIVAAKYYPYLLLLRYRILTDDYFPTYENTEYMFFGLKTTDHDGVGIHYDLLLNGRESFPSFVLRLGDLRDRDRPPSHISGGIYVESIFAAYDRLDDEQKHRIENAVSRFVFAQAPQRHVDEYSQILNLVSGIEGLLDIRPLQGKDEFGRQLVDIFGIAELKDWGRSVYALANDFRHQNFSTIQIVRPDTEERHRLFYGVPEETVVHTGHISIARAVLRELIDAKLFGGSPDTKAIRYLIFSNELPVKKVCEMICQNTPFGQPYYDLVNQIYQNKIGGTLKQKQRIVKFVCRTLFDLYPDKEVFNPATIDFGNWRGLIDRLSDIRQALKPMHSGQIINTSNIQRVIMLDKAAQLLWNIQIPLLSDLQNRYRPDKT